MWNSISRTVKIKGGNGIRLFSRKPFITPNTFIPGTKTLKERLEEMNREKEKLKEFFRVDIGLPCPNPIPRSNPRRRRRSQDKDISIRDQEIAILTRPLEVDLDELEKEWLRTTGPHDISKVAEHYGIYQDLFGGAYFIPYIPLEIGFPLADGSEAPVFRGNVVKPAEALFQPHVRFDAEHETLWTLILTNPDGHFTEENMEYVHWFVGNIPGNDISKGEVVWDYLQPFPPRGVGFQRFVFILYKQDKKIDYTSIKKNLPRLELNDRTFNTLEFYRQRQDDLTPGGLGFFQSDWDPSVIQTFHHKLNMDEPIFEYDFVPVYVRPQEKYPKKRAFNEYLDRYRDPKDIAKEYLLKKVENLNPFVKPEKPFPYPNALKAEENIPSWLRTLQANDRIGKGRITDYRDEEYE